MSIEAIYDLKKNCFYCYAFQNGQPFTTTFYEIHKKTFSKPLQEYIDELVKKMNVKPGKKPRIHIRFGQTVEVMDPPTFKNWPNYKDRFKQALELLLPFHEQYDLSTVIPSKTLPFNPEYVSLMKENNVSLFASVSNDDLEQGMIGHGFGTKERLENLLQYAKAGVNANIYLAVDFTRGVEAFNEYAQYAMIFFEKYKDVIGGVQLLDMRITRKEDAPAIGGAQWEELKTKPQHKQGLFYQGGWHLTGNGYLAADTIHPELKTLIKKSKGRIRGCYTHALENKNKICGNCFMDKKTRTGVYK